MPDLVRYQLRDGPHAGEPNTERGEIERLARECQAADCRAGLDSTVLETRFNVVRSSLPETITTVRRLRDYLPPDDRLRPMPRADAPGSCFRAMLGGLLDTTLPFGWRRADSTVSGRGNGVGKPARRDPRTLDPPP
jgi:hypothetical protein